MIDQDRLLELADAYLKSVIRDATGAASADVDSFAPFGELGIDSFRVLKIVKALEADFGNLPKTLLFEHFNVHDLARYFVEHHAQALSARCAAPVAAVPVRAAAAATVAAPAAVAPAAEAQPLLMLERDAWADPVLGELVRQIFERYKNDGSVSRGTRNIAPNLFIGSARKGYFHYSRSKNIIVAYTYTGPVDYFTEVAGELLRHCEGRGFELNLLAAHELAAVGEVRFSSTPFGVLQRVLDLPNFRLDGQAMRRLRYQVSKFEKAGVCRTEEFRGDADSPTRRDIAAMIDLWCAGRSMVNPLIHIVKDEILGATLDPAHRIFLSYVDDVLQNVILISPLSAELNGYLMDLEFYHKDMPLGGLEFTIVNIVRILVEEGCAVFSLGGTYGCKLEESANADPEVDKILDELRMQNIFNDGGNLQFKNKFRPENQTIYLCRPVGKCNPHNVIDIIMMIADPVKMQTSDEANHHGAKPAPAAVAMADVPAPPVPAPAAVPVAEGTVGIVGHARSFLLADAGYNPLKLAPGQVDFDLKTDSWAQLHLPAIDKQQRHLHAQLQQPANLRQALAELFPFAHFVLTTSGRSAESVFYKTWPRKGIVPQNLLFPTTIFHQIDQGFSPCELPHPAVFRAGAADPYKGDIDLAALRRQLERDAGAVAMVCIELGNNAAGGQPVSMDNLRQAKTLLAAHGVALVLDATRILENAHYLIEHDKDHAGQSVWQVARALAGHADALVISLAKDFCVTGGGLIATNDAALCERLEAAARAEGCALGSIEKKLLALALGDRAYIAGQAARRHGLARQLWNALAALGLPLVHPAGGHCVLVDVKRMPAFAGLPDPVASFVAWLYLETGIRAGAHSVGMQQGTSINGLARLAVPNGLRRDDVDAIVARIGAALAGMRNIPEIVVAGSPGAALGDVYAGYRLLTYHAPSAAPVGKMADATAVQPGTGADRAEAGVLPAAAAGASGAGARDIAIVGMAGRYPRAANLSALWNNLVKGADCIDEIPEERLAQRLHNDFSQRYRGGFLDGVDRFDAGFFGISARDARIMDPQERLFLEVACEAMEDAGYYPEMLGQDEASREVGVFVGAVWSSYQLLGVEEKIAGNNINPSSFLWSIANRVSYWMNLSGPSLTLDTACSSSLTALKLACDAINSGECAAAIAGGVNLDLHQAKFDINASGGSLSKDGVCRSYGKGANGYVSGEGVGALLLKPLARAIADGDQIHGVIKSAVVTHSGKTSAYTIPNPRTQASLVRKALEQGRIDARSIGYIEGHGTGTSLGDSIEVAALASAFDGHAVARQGCAIGSIKASIGHLEAASGIAGVHKILLQMKHRKLVASLHSAETNESIDFANSPFYVPQKLDAWEPKEVDGVRHPRRAGISTIGIGGTNAHLIIEEHQPAARADEPVQPADRIFPLSARTDEQLKEAALRLRDFLRKEMCSDAPGALPHEDDIAFTLLFGRKSFACRLAVVAKTGEELAEKLSRFLDGTADEDVLSGHLRNAGAVTGLLNAREKQDFVNLLVQGRDPRRLASLWSNGVIAEWQGLDIGQRGRRTSLPTYPFARERHWIVERQAAPLALLAAPPAIETPQATPAAAHDGAPRIEKYHFSMPKDPDGGAERRFTFALDEKSRLFVRQKFADQLKLSVDDVSDEARLMETGVTSIDMAEMTQALKERFDPAFSPTAFFECDTLADLAALLARKYEPVFQKMIVTKLIVEDNYSAHKARSLEGALERHDGPPLHVLDAQSALVLPAAGTAAPVNPGPARQVLLTGATGFLGIHLLAQYLESDSAVAMVCLVRAPDPARGLQRIVQQAESYALALDATRITVLCGDINAPRLGIAEQEWERCALDVDQIVHASAHVNHIEGYATFRASTQGMKEIIRLAGSGRLKLVQFISSTAACFHKHGDELSIFEKEDFVEDGAVVLGGYGQSKWVQETFLRRARDHGIPYVVYRFGELSGAEGSGRGQTDDMLHRLLQMRLAIGCREKVSSDVLDIVPVDSAARLIAGTGNAPALWNRIVHATHLQPYSFASLYRRAQAAGLAFAPVTREHYLARCYDFVQYIYAAHPVNGFVLECVLRDAEGAVRKRKIMDAYFAVLFPFAQDNFKHALHTLGFTLPAWGSLLDRYFSRWEEDDCGFMAVIRDYHAWRAPDEAGATPAALDDTLLEKAIEG